MATAGGLTEAGLPRADVHWTEEEKAASVREEKNFQTNGPGFLPRLSRLRRRRKTWPRRPA